MSEWSVPVQLDHSDSARDTQGHLRQVLRQGSEPGQLRFVGAEACSDVKAGLYKKLSIGLRTNLALREVTVTPFRYVTDASIYRAPCCDPHDRIGNKLQDEQADLDRTRRRKQSKVDSLGGEADKAFNEVHNQNTTITIGDGDIRRARP